jgi:hypothetical protein
MHGTVSSSATDRSPTAAYAPDFAAEFSSFAAALSIEKLPRAALDAPKANLLDTLACANVGISVPGVGEVLDLVRGWPEGTAERLTDAVAQVEGLADARSLTAILTSGGAS